MKKSLSLLLALVMILSLTACGGGTQPTTAAPTSGADATTTAATSSDSTEAPQQDQSPKGTVTVGQGTELSGDWITTFTNNASDNTVLGLISGYGTFEKDFNGEFQLNKVVVKDVKIDANADGSKTYTYTINDGLVWSDNTPITAKDYVGGLLLWNNKFIAEIGGKNLSDYRLVGHTAYSKGETETFPGVHLIDDKTFSMTVDAKYLPYYFEAPLFAAGPTNLKYWVGDIDVVDTPEGAKFSEALTVEKHKDLFEKGRNNPIYISSGPYVVDSYDTATKIAVLKVNPVYAGNFEGQKPRIETIVFKKVITETQMDELATGQVDILTGMLEGSTINPGLELVEKGGFDFVNYPRAGYGKITFVCDFGPTQFKEVRQALAHLLNRNEFAKSFTGGFGSIVNGPYGESQWFYQETRQELNAKLNQYPYDLAAAVKLLEGGGWVLDAQGGEYKEGIRYKKLDDGTLMPLEIEWCSTNNNQVSELLTVMLQNNVDVEKAGIKINRTEMTFPELLNFYSRDGSQDPKYAVPTYHMYNLASNYSSSIYDLQKSYTTNPDEIKQGYNVNFLIDEKLEKLAIDMVVRDGADREGFKKGFVDFISYWNELLPDLPLYSNIIHDFFNAKLKDYQNTPLAGIGLALLYARVEE